MQNIFFSVAITFNIAHLLDDAEIFLLREFYVILRHMRLCK